MKKLILLFLLTACSDYQRGITTPITFSGIYNDSAISIPVEDVVEDTKEITEDVDKVKLLKVMDMQVARNSFGRQRESFEKNITIEDFHESYKAVFIRAPTIKRVWGKCKVLSKIDKEIIMARQDKFLALSFHPELTDDLRVHRYFLDMIA